MILTAGIKDTGLVRAVAVAVAVAVGVNLAAEVEVEVSMAAERTTLQIRRTKEVIGLT